jgi:hypothetical protein
MKEGLEMLEAFSNALSVWMFEMKVRLEVRVDESVWMLLLLEISCQRGELRGLFMLRLDKVRDQDRRCSQRDDAFTSLKLPSPTDTLHSP